MSKKVLMKNPLNDIFIKKNKQNTYELNYDVFNYIIKAENLKQSPKFFQFTIKA